jgi:hypothetical protein
MASAQRRLPNPVLPAVLRRLAEAPWIRPDAVARGRAHLAARPDLSAEELATSVVERLVAERVR